MTDFQPGDIDDARIKMSTYLVARVAELENEVKRLRAALAGASHDLREMTDGRTQAGITPRHVAAALDRIRMTEVQ